MQVKEVIGVREVIGLMKFIQDPEIVNGMARFGIATENCLGISMPDIRGMAKQIGKDHMLALELWTSGVHEAKILACIIDDYKKVTEKQMEKWVLDFDSWDVCDQCCMNLFDKTPFAINKIFEWTNRDEEFVKRAGFALIATTAVHNKKLDDETFHEFFPLIIREATDERNFVKKAVNWALRQIGKRNMNLNLKALETANEILTINSKSAKWIANDAIRELTDEKIIQRIQSKK